MAPRTVQHTHRKTANGSEGGGYDARQIIVAIETVVEESSHFLVALEDNGPIAVLACSHCGGRMVHQLRDTRLAAEGKDQERDQEVGSPTQHVIFPPDERARR
ncbi:MAG TPA: hypothetical protein VFA18_10965 [Gemmataceae bacterium]|nr:hypothetical protein [Gemmataceae bacterium]